MYRASSCNELCLAHPVPSVTNSKSRGLTVLIALSSLLFSGQAKTRAEQLGWPIDATIRFTSSFCEYRPFRFHAGIDLSTGGVTGVPVRAVADGYVWRLRVSPYGYGKVIYLRLRDGRSAVYAHLDRFSDVLNRLVRLEQERRRRYTIDVTFAPNQAVFSKGDIIGWSGRTGIGVPHLHFELRDRANRPTDPLSNGLTFDDTVSPTIGVLSFIPLDGDARVDERIEPVAVPLAKYDGVWSSTKRVALWGRVGIAMAGWDRTQMGRYRLSLRSMNVAVDGVEVFSRRYSEMSFASQHLSVFDRNFNLIATGAGRYFNMFIQPGNTLEYYDSRPIGSGILACAVEPTEPGEYELTPGLHELSVTVFDFDGNSAEARLPIVVGRRPQIAEFSVRESEDGRSLHIAAYDTLDQVSLEGFLSDDACATWRSVERTRDDTTGFEHGQMEVFLPSIHDSLYVRIVAEDTLDQRSVRVVRVADLLDEPEIRISQKWGRDWCAFDVRASRPLATPPTVAATWGTEKIVPMPAAQISQGLYEAEIRPDPSWPQDFIVRVLAGEGPPTIVSQWRQEDRIPGRCDPVLSLDSTEARYRAVVTFTDHFPDSGAVRLSIAGGDTSFSVEGRRIGPWGGEYYLADGSAGLEVGYGVMPEPMFVRIEREKLPSWPGLEPIGDGYVFEPQVYPLVGEATTVIAVPDSVDLTGVGLFAYSPRGAELVTPAEGRFDHTLRTRVRSLSTVGVYRDLTPPEIMFVSPGTGASTATPRMHVRLVDRGAGFAKSDDAMEMLIDDQWVPAEYDPEEDRLVYVPPFPLSRGRHTVVIHARDAVGNEATATREFTIE